MAFPTDWGRRCSLAIQDDNVDATLTNFPVLLSKAALPEEMFDADGSYPALNGGGDIRFSSDEAGDTQLACEIVNFVTDNDPANGEAEVWVKVASVSGSAPTTIYIWYNKAGETQPAEGDAYGKNAVWSQDYLTVHHMQGAAAATVKKDNSEGTSAYDIVEQDTPISADGFIGDGDGAYYIDNVTTAAEYLTCGTSSTLGISSTSYNSQFRTYSMWVKLPAVSGTNAFMGKWRKNAAPEDKNFEMVSYGNPSRCGGAAGRNGITALEIYPTSGINVSDTAWHYISFTWSSDNKIRTYTDATLMGTTSASTAVDAGSSMMRIGDIYSGTGVKASYDEVRISSVARTTAWLKAEYHSQSAPATFTEDGTPESPDALEFTGDANLAEVVDDDFTGDASLLREKCDTFFGDSNLLRSVSETFTSDANLKIGYELTFTGDASLESVEATTFTGDANLKRTLAPTFSGDASLLKILDGQWSGDANLQVELSATFSGDSSLKAVVSDFFTGDAFLLIEIPGSFTGDSSLLRSVSETFTGDANLFRTVDESFTGDAAMMTLVVSSFTGDAHFAETFSFNFTGDASLKSIETTTFTGDAHFAEIFSSNFTGDASLKSVETATFTGDASIATQYITSFTSDASLKSVESATFTGDTNLIKTAAVTFTGDTNLRKTESLTFQGDASLVKVIEGAFTSDSSIKKVVADAYTADANLVGEQMTTFTGDANLLALAITYTFTSDASLVETISGLFDSDASLLRANISDTFSGDADLIFMRYVTVAGLIDAIATSTSGFAGTVDLDGQQQSLGFGLGSGHGYPLKIYK